MRGWKSTSWLVFCYLFRSTNPKRMVFFLGHFFLWWEFSSCLYGTGSEMKIKFLSLSLAEQSRSVADCAVKFSLALIDQFGVSFFLRWYRFYAFVHCICVAKLSRTMCTSKPPGYHVLLERSHRRFSTIFPK